MALMALPKAPWEHRFNHSGISRRGARPAPLPANNLSILFNPRSLKHLEVSIIRPTTPDDAAVIR